MSFYNMLQGTNLSTFFILPMLGEKHPDAYPRYRDCFVGEKNGQPVIQVYTRVGGSNRGCDYGEQELYKHPNYIGTEDDSFDCTYASYWFSVPDRFKVDFDLILAGKLPEISEDYKVRLYKVFPKLKEKFDELFKV